MRHAHFTLPVEYAEEARLRQRHVGPSAGRASRKRRSQLDACFDQICVWVAQRQQGKQLTLSWMTQKLRERLNRPNLALTTTRSYIRRRFPGVEQ